MTAVQLPPPPAVSTHTKTGGFVLPRYCIRYEVFRSTSIDPRWKALFSVFATTPAFSRMYIVLSDDMIDRTSAPLRLSCFHSGTSCSLWGQSVNPFFRQASHIKLIEIALNIGSPFSCLRSIMSEYSHPSDIGVVIPISAVCSTSSRGAMVSLNSSGGIRAASSSISRLPPVPLVPCGE